MGLTLDPAHRWRSTDLAFAPVREVSVQSAVRGRDDNEAAGTGFSGDKETEAWYNGSARVPIDDMCLTAGMRAGVLKLAVEIGSAKPSSADEAVVQLRSVPYSYVGKPLTVSLSHAGRHFVARPALNETVAMAMYEAPTADKWVAATNFKLPRTVAAPGAAPQVPGLPNGGGGANLGLPNNFDAVRRVLVECARGDDYGYRLFSLARVVMHAETMRRSGISPRETPVMADQNMFSITTGDTPHLTEAQINNYAYAYNHTEQSPQYRAFLTMGLRGVGHYAMPGTIYSDGDYPAECAANHPISFVRVGGPPPANVAPDPPHYTAVLSNPGLALSYYWAYAYSMGLGRVAGAILAQASLAPHIWGSAAVAPYKNCAPKLDAAAYLLLPDQETAHVTADSARELVANAAVLSEAYLAGIGATLMSARDGGHQDTALMMRAVTEKLSDPETRRGAMLSITSRLCPGGVGMEWLSPFSYDVLDGTERCIRAWRNHGFLLALYDTSPVAALAPLFSTGVAMNNSLLDRKSVVTGAEYPQLVACALAGRAELAGRCEKPSQAYLAALAGHSARMRAWTVVVTVLGVVPPASDDEDLADAYEQVVSRQESSSSARPQSSQSDRSVVRGHGAQEQASLGVVPSSPPPIAPLRGMRPGSRARSSRGSLSVPKGQLPEVGEEPADRPSDDGAEPGPPAALSPPKLALDKPPWGSWASEVASVEARLTGSSSGPKGQIVEPEYRGIVPSRGTTTAASMASGTVVSVGRRAKGKEPEKAQSASSSSEPASGGSRGEEL
uniref:Uncharacterized protein n=1 Tax=Magnaporthe oryzae chrysovirus 1 TaxID=764348 RepID=A0A8E6Z7V7_9VIRU|nr:hypothetical protein [Magnaporthe oryzae chrysovirus 1]